MSDKRKNYKQFCGVARALDRVGERWTLLVVRNLLLGPRRYSDLLQELPGITSNLLAKRLRELCAAGVIERRRMAAPLRVEVYALTPAGEALEPVIMELGRWGGRFLDRPRPGDIVNIGWGLLSMKRRYRGGLSLVAGLRIDDRHFELEFRPDYLAVTEREPSHVQVSVKGSLESFQRWFFRGVPATRLREQGALAVNGSEAAWLALAQAFVEPSGLLDAQPKG